MNFTQDYFSHNIPFLTAMMNIIPNKKRFLEVGSFEGRSTCWFLEQMDDDGVIHCIDTWAGSEEHSNLNLTGLRERFDINVDSALRPGQTVLANQMTSYRGLAFMSVTEQEFDFIYIDGSHQAPDVITDACMAFPLLKPGGVMVFDDFLWGKELGVLHSPKIAIDAFVTIFSERCNIVGIGGQLAVQKI